VNIDFRAFFQDSGGPTQAYGWYLGEVFTAFSLVGTESGGVEAGGIGFDRVDVRV